MKYANDQNTRFNGAVRKLLVKLNAWRTKCEKKGAEPCKGSCKSDLANLTGGFKNFKGVAKSIAE